MKVVWLIAAVALASTPAYAQTRNLPGTSSQMSPRPSPSAAGRPVVRIPQSLPPGFGNRLRAPTDPVPSLGNNPMRPQLDTAPAATRTSPGYIQRDY